MKKGQMLATTTTVIEKYEAIVNGKYYGDAYIFEVYIEEIHHIYVLEYSSRETAYGIEHKHFDTKAQADDAFNDVVKSIKQTVIDDLVKSL